MPAYYNDNDPKVCAWLRELIKEGLIADGDVDERSIADVQPSDLAGYTQCHFFAGIGGWSLALRLAGWSDDRSVWTGSCPCQPFSCAGKGRGESDKRHLWPEFRRLIAECRPPVVFGEQVASKLGREWFHAGVRPDLEALGYGGGAADLCAACVGAPHIRQRLYWVADRCSVGFEITGIPPVRRETRCADAGSSLRMGNTSRDDERRHSVPGAHGEGESAGGSGSVGGLVDAGCPGDERRLRSREAHGEDPAPAREGIQRERSRTNAWSNSVLIPCADGKARRIEPGLEPLAHGVPGRVGLLRGYGNAIVPAVAAEFVMAYEEACRPA